MQTSYAEKIHGAVKRKAAENALPLLTALITGLVTYLFCFANKLEIHDDLGNMFSQGYPVSSGRWGLEIIEKIFPTASIPWLNGLVSLFLFSVSICIIIRMFEIRSPLLQTLLAAVLVSFPSQMTTYAYMFTTIQYACGMLLSVWAAYLLSRRDDRLGLTAGGVLLVLSLSIYQPYIAVAASLLVVRCFALTLSEDHTGKEIVIRGLKYVAVIVISMAVYYGILAIFKSLSDMPFNAYAEGSLNSFSDILKGIVISYTSYAGYFIKGYYDIVRPGAPRIAHFAVLIVCCILLIRHFGRSEARRNGRLGAALLCLCLLPLAVNCIHVISSLFHNLMTFSFVSFYVLAAVVLETCGKESGTKPRTGWVCTDITALSLCVVMVTNVYFANAVYLRMYMQEEQAKAFYQTIVSALNAQPDFDENSWVIFFGENDVLNDFPVISTENQAGIREGILQTYGQDYFIRYYLGLRLNTNILTESTIPEGWDDVIDWDAVIAMPSYPAYGCVQKMGESDGSSIFFVRLG